jgi:hypothetical protein
MTKAIPVPVPLDASNFSVDFSYQRPPEERLPYLKGIAAKFDNDLFGVITVSKRGKDHYVIVDGAGRCYIFYTLLGRTGKLPCIVYEDLKVADEAQKFVDLNRQRKLVSNGQIFKARCAIGDKLAKAIARIFKDAAMTVGAKPGIHNIASVESVEDIYERFDADTLQRSLLLKRNSGWRDQVCSGGFLEAFALLIKAQPQLDTLRMHEVLNVTLPTTLKDILINGKQGGVNHMPLKRYVPLIAAEHLAARYNRDDLADFSTKRGSLRINRIDYERLKYFDAIRSGADADDLAA